MVESVASTSNVVRSDCLWNSCRRTSYETDYRQLLASWPVDRFCHCLSHGNVGAVRAEIAATQPTTRVDVGCGWLLWAPFPLVFFGEPGYLDRWGIFSDGQWAVCSWQHVLSSRLKIPTRRHQRYYAY
jgi:hypothetical protein